MSVCSTSTVALLSKALIIAIMGSRHHPLQGEAPPIFFERAQSLQVVATAL